MSLKKILLSLLIIVMLAPVGFASTLVENSDKLIGTWSIYDENNNFIDSIIVDFAVSMKGRSRFSYKQNSLNETGGNDLDGYMINKDQLIIQLFTLGESSLYIAQLDFNAGGGPGVELKTKLADCEVVGVNNNLVAKKNGSRLTGNSALCDSSDFQNSTTRNIKFVKEGVAPAAIPSTAVISSGIISALDNRTKRISGAWNVAKGPKARVRIITKNVEAHHLGYSFVYRRINNKKPLKDITNTDFLSGEIFGFMLGDFLVIDNSEFNRRDRLGVFRVNKSNRGSGRLFITPNGDCFPLRNPDPNKRVCTPNFDTNRTATITRVLNKAKINKMNTKVNISF
jgi:hypothetical protein